MRAVVITLISVLLLLVESAPAEDWISQVVDNEGVAGQGSFTWIDDQGAPHIAYHRYFDGDHRILHTYWTGTGWQTNSLGQGVWMRGAVDDNGAVHIVFGGADITYVQWIDDSIHVDQTIHDPQYGYYGDPCIALDSCNQPHVFYSGPSGKGHLYLECGDTVWQSGSMYNGSDFADCDEHFSKCWFSAAIDDSNHIYFVFTSRDGHLKVAYYDGSAWGSSFIDPDEEVGEYCDIEIDSSGVPHIAYYDKDNTRLKYATFTTGSKREE